MSESPRKSNSFPWKNSRPRDEEHRYRPPPPSLGTKAFARQCPPTCQSWWVLKQPSPPPAIASQPPHSPKDPPMTLQPPPPPPFLSSSGSAGSNLGSGKPRIQRVPGGVTGLAKTIFPHELLAMATNGFSSTNFLGKGRFGSVYKGVLSTGKEVVVKQLEAGSVQGERELWAEVESICHVNHKSLVSMEGICITGSHRLLVYEFVPQYFEVPLTCGKLIDKSNVFSYGVVLLVLITGRAPLDPTHSTLADWARPLLAQALERQDFDALVDPRLQNDYDRSEMTRMVTCAAACVHRSASCRPQISEIVSVLRGDDGLLSDLSKGVKASLVRCTNQ